MICDNCLEAAEMEGYDDPQEQADVCLDMGDYLPDHICDMKNCRCACNGIL
jgi:hypothetical protein